MGKNLGFGLEPGEYPHPHPPCEVTREESFGVWGVHSLPTPPVRLSTATRDNYLLRAARIKAGELTHSTFSAQWLTCLIWFGIPLVFVFAEAQKGKGLVCVCLADLLGESSSTFLSFDA